MGTYPHYLCCTTAIWEVLSLKELEAVYRVLASETQWHSTKECMADKPLVLLHGEIKSPPFSATARIQAGFLLRQLQKGLRLSMPHSRPMPSIGSRCHELRIPDPETGIEWRVIYRLDSDAVLVAEVFPKKTRQTPKPIITACQRRFKRYDDLLEEEA